MALYCLAPVRVDSLEVWRQVCLFALLLFAPFRCLPLARLFHGWWSTVCLIFRCIARNEFVDAFLSELKEELLSEVKKSVKGVYAHF